MEWWLSVGTNRFVTAQKAELAAPLYGWLEISKLTGFR
jgi:hypothetical protein